MSKLSRQHETPHHHCANVYFVDGRQVVNKYKCGQPSFSLAQLLKIQQQRKQVRLTQGLAGVMN